MENGRRQRMQDSVVQTQAAEYVRPSPPDLPELPDEVLFGPWRQMEPGELAYLGHMDLTHDEGCVPVRLYGPHTSSEVMEGLRREIDEGGEMVIFERTK